MSDFEFQITTPKGVPFSERVVSLILPGENGFFGVLAHHTSLLAACKPGKLKIRDTSEHETAYEIGSGFFEMAGNRAVLITEGAAALPSA